MTKLGLKFHSATARIKTLQLNEKKLNTLLEVF